MKKLLVLSFTILISVHIAAQSKSELKDEENRILANKILEENGLKYYNNYTYRIKFDWNKIHPWEISFALFQKTLSETDFHGQKLKLLKTDDCVYSETITAEEISTTVFKNKEGKSLRIKDVASVDLYERTCTGAVDTPNGLFINCRTINNEPQLFLFANNTLTEFVNLKNYIVCAFSPKANELLVTKYDKDPGGDSMSHEIYTYNLKSQLLKRQCDFGWVYSTPHYTKNHDSIVFIVNENNADGIGSHGRTMTVKVK